MSTVIATRGERLALARFRLSGRDQRPEAFHSELLGIVETDADGRVAACIVFDPDDTDAAFAELDARYLAGEAAAHSHTWSVIAAAHSAVNRHEVPATTPDWTLRDNRPITTFEAADLSAFLDVTWSLTANIHLYVAAVHRLSDLGAVVTHTSRGTAQEGVDVEWRLLALFTVDGDMISRSELFDEAHIDEALARFDELYSPTSQPGNAASRLIEQFRSCFTARNWAEMTELLADDISTDDRRRVVSEGSQRGRHVDVASMRALADVGVTNMTPTLIATRGDRLALSRARMSRARPAP